MKYENIIKCMKPTAEDIIKFIETEGYYTHLRIVPGRGVCGIWRLLYTYGLVYGLDYFGYRGRYCYKTEREAVEALNAWNGEGDPPGNWIVNKGEPGGDRQNPNRPTLEEKIAALRNLAPGYFKE